MTALQQVEQINVSVSEVKEWILALLRNHRGALDSPHEALALAAAADSISAAELQQLIDQQGIGLDTERLVELINAIRTDLPDASGFSHNLGGSYQTGTSFTLNLAGATTPGGKPVLYKLSNLVHLTASTTATTGSVTLTFGNNPGAASLTVTPTCGEIAADPIQLNTSLFTASIQQPTINSPAQNATDVALKPLITWSGYTTIPANHDSYLAAEVRIKDSSGTIVWQSGELSAVTSTTVTENLPGETALDIEVRQKGSLLGWGEWSAVRRVTTRIEMYPGKVMPDGGICGPVFDGWQLIVAPASKRGDNISHGLHGTETSLANIVDEREADPQSGYDNTNELISGYSGINDGFGSIGPVAAIICRYLGPEWYLPNKDELKAIVDMAAQIDASDSFGVFLFSSMASGDIWSSTEVNKYNSWVVRADGTAVISSYTRSAPLYIVPVRRVPV